MMIVDMVERGVKLGSRLGADEVEVYVIRRTLTDIAATVRGVEKISSGQVVVAGVRVVLGRRVSIQGGLVSKVDDVDPIVETAVKIARTLPEDPQWVSLPKDLGRTGVEDVLDPKIRDPDLGYFLEATKLILEKAREVDRRAFTSSASMRLSTVERALGNSYGGLLVDESTEFSAFVSVKAEEAGEESGFYDFYLAPTLRDFDPERLVARATEIAVKTLRARRVETGTYELVLTPRILAGVLRSLIVPAISADSVQRGRSPLKGREGSQVLSESITLIDDGTYPGLAGTRSFDDEGVRTGRKVVFERGVLRGFLYDTYTALVEGKSSTGNAYRPVPYAAPAPWISNVLLEPGSGTLDDMLRDVRRGVVVYATIGEWLSNPVSGMLNATITNGMYIENGEERFPVRGVVVSGNIYEVLRHPEVRVAASVERFERFALPATYVPRITLAGK